ncbi:glycine betaine ABC transporter substrate-binding protein [Nesterenkonia jeotgali]|uniref:Glycine betaine/choline ABC-type transport system substrate-binding protein n=1 Tax=Nesterenkonia jeotgali TaxID=317018 RepID=A0A839FK80_9MICC|nr:glycine betaine ABC transporter substrate-binding protein [Nesterenkonia jeotgali]MBA8920266.1 glycine betaine/choline ABC-type transport system substrate-binding protein [Nesterenkonia jeotgali]
MTFPPSTPRRVRGVAGSAAVAIAAAIAVTSCSPPPPAEEPTGSAAERAWTIAVGEHPLDQTIANVYALALNSRDTLAVVQTSERRPAEAITEGGGDMFIGRSMALARQVDPEGFAELEQPSSSQLLGVIEDGLDEQATLLEPSAAVLGSSLVITSVTAELNDIATEGEVDDPAFAEACDELRIGVRPNLPEPEPLLAEVYDCEPAEIVVAGEAELLEGVITAELDAAILTTSHPGIQEQALIALTDAERAFPQEQFVPVVSAEIAEEVPPVATELAQALNEEALVTLRRLTDGEQGLSPQEAAEYWLVQEGFVAEPEDWG